MAVLAPPTTQLVLTVIFYGWLVVIVLAAARAFWLSRKVSRNLGHAASARLISAGLALTLLSWFLVLILVTPFGPDLREIRTLCLFAALELKAYSLWLVGSGYRVLLADLRSLAGSRNLGDR